MPVRKDAFAGWLIRLARESEGQDLMEYAMLAAFVAICMAAGLSALKSAVGALLLRDGSGIGAGS